MKEIPAKDEPEILVEEGSAALKAVPDIDEPESDEAEEAETEEPKPAESAAGIAALEVFRDGKSEQVLEIAGSESRIMIGRSEDSELCLKSEFVSRHHALIICSDNGLYIEDLNSFNGTLVNSDKISRRKLEIGDTVMIGKFEIKANAA